MTLCIGTIIEQELYLFGDERLSSELPLNIPEGSQPPDAGLKIFFLRPHMAVAYAGTVAIADSIIKEAISLAARNISLEGIAEFLKKQVDKARDVDFLLADVAAGSQLIKITPSMLSIGYGPRWIGVGAAADRLLGNEFENVSDFYGRFQTLLDEREFPSIGGIVAAARGTASGFKFMSFARLVSPHYAARTDGQWYGVDFGNAAQGGFGYTLIVPKEVGRNGWGVHYFQGRMGHFFKLGTDGRPNEKLVWRDASLSSAVEALQNDVGFEVEYAADFGNR